MRPLHREPAGASASELNWLRAAVLGANDGIVSLSALVVGVAGATTTLTDIALTGVAGLLAGALSMAVGEYVSVSSQRDAEVAILSKERHELETVPEAELEELTQIYEKKGLQRATAETVAHELSANDVFVAHAEAELGIKPHELTNPLSAALASAVSFVAGAVIPLLAILLPPASVRVPVTFAAVFVALLITGVLSARMSGTAAGKPTVRILVGGILAMAVTFGIGKFFGASL